MKRFLLLVLTMVILFSTAAQAATGDRTFKRSDEVLAQDPPLGSCVAGDVLYLFGSRHIYSYRVGDDAPAAMEFELPASEEKQVRELKGLFAQGDQFFALLAVYNNGENARGLACVEIAEVELNGGVRFGDAVQADATALTMSYGSDYSELTQIYGFACINDRLYLDVYPQTGGRKIYVLQMDSGEGAFLEIENVAGLCAWEEDKLLIETRDSGAGRVALLSYSVGDGRLETVCELERELPLSGIAYSAQSQRLFYLEGGYVMAVQDFDFAHAEAVAELVTRDGDEPIVLLLPGDYYVYCSLYDSVSIRSTAPGALPEERLVVQCSGIFQPMMDAYYSFNETHSDAAVVLREDWSEGSSIVEAMMRRDASSDIYAMSVNTEAFDALYKRGYMAAIESVELENAVGEMYPAIRDALTRNGELIAVPIYTFGWTLGLDFEGFEKLGIPREEMPDNWPDFLELLSRLPELLPEDGSVRIFFDDYNTQRQMRRQLLNQVFESWHLGLKAAGQEVYYDSPELRTVLEGILALDLAAMGLPEGGDDEQYFMVSVVGGGEDDHILVQLDTDATIGYYSSAEPALLSIAPGGPRPVPMGLTVAFINPFSEHATLAAEYLTLLYENLSASVLYNLSDRLNEPVRSPYYQENLESAQRELDAARAALEQAKDVDKPMWEDRIAALEGYLERIDEYGWDISPKDIAWHRAHADGLVVKGYDYVNITDSGNAYADLVAQLLDGRMNAEAFLKELDRQVRMKAREEI